MKKFLIKMTTCFIIVVVLLFFLNALYMGTEYYKNLNDMGKFEDLPTHFDVVNLGASHSFYAFNWDEYDFDGVSLALEAQTLVYDAALFDFYLDRMDENTTVIIEIMYKSLYEQEPNIKPYGTNITRYYQVLDKQHIKQWNLSDAFLYRFIPILSNREKALNSLVDEYIWGKASNQKSMNNKEIFEQTINSEPTQVLDGWKLDDMVIEGKRRAQIFIDASGKQEKREEYDALIHIIDICQSKGIKIIFVTAPTLPCFYNGFPESFTKTFYTDINTICDKYQIPYYDYTGDKRLLTDYRWYRDTDHLNKIGSKLFTRYFYNDHLVPNNTH